MVQMSRSHLRITAAIAFLALCGIGGYSLAAPSSKLPASCFTNNHALCLAQWEAAR
jgi:hypothetical protein